MNYLFYLPMAYTATVLSFWMLPARAMACQFLPKERRRGV